MKDTTPVAGMPYTMGSDIFGDFVPGHDAFLVRRLREAGFVIVGKTNMPEFGILPVTEPRRFGPARNPWTPSARRAARPAARLRGGGRHGPARPRQRRRRLDPDPGGVLRPGGAEAHPRPHLARARAGRRLPRPGRRAHAHGGRDGRAARRAERLRGRRRDLGPAPGRAVRGSGTREPGRLRIGYTTTRRHRGRASTPSASAAP